jgi:predicted nucleotidyltransferase
MGKAEALKRLRDRGADLRALGIRQLSIFGSTARGDARADSDVDLAAIVDYDAVRRLGPFGFFGIGDRIASLLGAKVDFVTEPHEHAPRLQAEIDRDRVRVF